MVSWITYHTIAKKGTGLYETEGNKAVWTNYARDLMYMKKYITNLVQSSKSITDDKKKLYQ